ncbi:MAG: hypothetical protein ACRCX2_24695 [Paraclostridium sp.]
MKMTDYIKNKIESQRKIQEQKEIEYRSRRLLPDVDNHLNKEYVDKMTKEQKTSVNIELDPELLEKIDQEAAQDLRTRKAQVLYIIREYFNRNKLGLEKKKFIWDDLKFKKPWENIWENIEIVGDNNKNEPEEK